MGDAAHIDHDVERLVDYVDDELDAGDRAAAERQIAECGECARLVADLRALAVANRDAPVLSGRPRDFRLSETEAARIRAEVAAEEPGSAPARLVIEMPNLPSAHADHDPMLIAAASDGRLEPAERVVADTWLESCDDCAALHRDLVAIASANRTLWTPARVRDNRLDEATAARLRGRLRGRDWRGFQRWIGSSRDTFTRPLAVGLTTLGIVGLLLTGSGSLLSFSSSSSGAAILSTVGGPVGAESAPGDAAAAAPSESSDRNVFSGQGEAPEVQGGDDGSGAAGAAPVAAASAAAAPAASAAPSAATTAASEAPTLASAAPLTQPNPSAAFVAPAAPSAASSATSDQSRDAASAASAAPPAASSTDAYAKDTASDGVPPLVWLSVGLLIAGIALFVIRRVARTSRA